MNTEKPNILIVDDDSGLRTLLMRYLSEQGFNTAAVADGKAMFKHIEQQPVDLIVLDLMLPGEDGLSLTKTLKAASGPPIIMLSAHGEDIDRIIGLEVGVDDYLGKPFNPRELKARIHSILRRHQSTPTDVKSNLSFGPYTLDTQEQVCRCNGEDVQLTRAEYTLLKILLEHPGRTLSRDHLIDLLKGYERHPNDRTIDVRITRLRKKLEPDPSSPIYIHTVWGEGYRFTTQGSNAC